METIKDFGECISMTNSKRHLILGNGFSVDIFPEIFNYKKLAEKISDPKIREIFSEFNTSDFEFVVSKLTDSLKVLNHYDTERSVYNKVEIESEKLKELLIKVITSSHPENPSKISAQQFQSCFDFLKHFEEGKKYSFNYDLILYWVYMHFLEDEANNLSADDGFRTDEHNDSMVTWEIGREHTQNLYYLHGAMHIFKTESGTIQKYTWRNGDKTIGEQVKESIEKNQFPVFISEGTQEHKLKRIKENGYLSRSFSSLKSITGDLFIFGHSLRDEDDHVFEIMNSNKSIKRIFISTFGDFTTETRKIKLQKVNDWRAQYSYKGREYIFYDASSAKVWNRYSSE